MKPLHPAQLSPSMMCADLFRMDETLRIFTEEHVEYLHIDVMDGRFVPNFTLGTDYCKALKQRCGIPLDLHLMVERPEEKLDWFPFGAGDLVSVHAESTPHLQKALAQIRQRGALPFAALNPATPLGVLDEVLEDLAGVLVMTVNPGFAGQRLIPQTLDKLKRLRARLDERGFETLRIEVDGNVSFENAARMRECGADLFVAGTSSVFAPALELAEGVRRLRAAVADRRTDACAARASGI